jgi:hypothetical protein
MASDRTAEFPDAVVAIEVSSAQRGRRVFARLADKQRERRGRCEATVIADSKPLLVKVAVWPVRAVFGALLFSTDCHRLRPLCSINAPYPVACKGNKRAS